MTEMDEILRTAEEYSVAPPVRQPPDEYSVSREDTASPEEYCAGYPVSRVKKGAKTAAALAILSVRMLSVSVDPTVSSGLEDTVRPITEPRQTDVSSSDPSALLSAASYWTDAAGSTLFVKGDCGWLVSGDTAVMITDIRRTEDGNGEFSFDWAYSSVDLTPGVYSSSVRYGEGLIVSDGPGILTVSGVFGDPAVAFNVQDEPQDLSRLEKLTGSSTGEMLVSAGFWKPASAGPYGEIATLSDGTGYVTVDGRMHPVTWSVLEENELEISVRGSGWSLSGEGVSDEGSFSMICVVCFRSDGIHLCASREDGILGYRDFVPKN